MRWLVCYFSGRGNTQKIAGLWSDALRKSHAETQLWPIEQGNTEITDADHLALLWPVYAFNAPWFVRDWVERLPEAKKDVTLISVSGEPLTLNMASSCTLEKLLKRKGYRIDGRYNYVMPYSIMFRYSDERVWRLWQAAKALVPVDVEEVLEGKGRTGTVTPWQKLATGILRIESWGGRFNGRFYSVDTRKCVKCKKCVAHCPVHNISWGRNDRPTFGKRCLMCQRCAMYCPGDAISIGLFARWKVNGPYSFQKPTAPQKQAHAWYCKNAFDRYFQEVSRRTGKIH